MDQQVGNVRVVEQAMDVLFTIARQEQPQGIRAFAEQLDISKTTLQRILGSLQRCDLIAFNAAKNVHTLTSKSLFLAASYQREQDLVGILRPAMESLRAASGETVTLSIAVDGYRVTIFQLESLHDLRHTTQLGKAYPIVLGATGKVLLAQMTDQARQAAIAQYGTQVDLGGGDVRQLDPVAIERSVEEAMADGYAESHGEWSDGGFGLSVPILTGNGQSAALSVYGVEGRLNGLGSAQVIEQLLEISRSLSWAEGVPTNAAS
jgi:DNA-binding IclR family transcriptional regulator